MWRTWVIYLVGLWVFVSGFVPGYPESLVHNGIFGLLAAGLGVWDALSGKPLMWGAAAGGLWLVVSTPFLGGLWNNVLAGLVIAGFSFAAGLIWERHHSF